MVLLLTSVFSVILSDIAVVYLMIPSIAVVYAVIFSLIHWAEGLLPRFDFLQELEDCSNLVNILDLVEDTPPVTRPRREGAQDIWDLVTYPARRHARVPRFYFDRISDKLQTILQWSIASVVMIRLTCIFFNLQALLLAVAPFFLGAFFRGRIGRQDTTASQTSKQTSSLGRQGIRNRFFHQIIIPLSGAMLLMVGVYTYKNHVSYFGHLQKGEDLTEKFFWHAVEGVFYINKSKTAWILKTIWLASSTIWLALCFGFASGGTRKASA